MREKGGPRGFGPPALGIRCREIQNPEERLACYDAALGGAQGAYVESRGESSMGWPEPCQKANALTRESCESVMRQFSEQQKQEFEEFHEEGFSGEGLTQEDMRLRCESEGGSFVCEGDNCFCRFGESSTTSGTTTTTEPTPTETTTTTTESTTSGTSEGTITGGVIFGDNGFLKYFYR